MKNCSFYIIIGVALLTLFSACGRRQTAKSVVNDFIEQNALSPEKMTAREFSSLDSTKFLNDSIVLSMQKRGHELYKHGISYEQSSSGRILYYLRMKCVYENDTLQQTFYLDENLTSVVSFK